MESLIEDKIDFDLKGDDDDLFASTRSRTMSTKEYT